MHFFNKTTGMRCSKFKSGSMIQWGIIGCGDVTEVKSGPAFNKIPGSILVAVMRRDSEKAKSYAARHQVPKWYADADALIHDPDVNAVYIATPPSTHEQYTLAALNAGKPVYVEKPMALNAESAKRMVDKANEKNLPLVVAHYRREQPMFKKVKHLLEDGTIGWVWFAKMEFYKRPQDTAERRLAKNAWRINTAISGGGLFHDLAPHQLDLMYYFFGEADTINGMALNQQKLYDADDIVTGNILFKSGIVFNGLWCFGVDENEEKDICEIVGSKGKIQFSVFGEPKINLVVEGKKENILFDALAHVQQPMIQKVVDYFLGHGPNPCPGEDGVTVMEMMDKMVGRTL